MLSTFLCPVNSFFLFRRGFFVMLKRVRISKKMDKEKLLLLSCCAPCSVGVIEQLSRQHEDVTVLFYNPNIRPAEEYAKRLAENKRVCREYGVLFVELEYNPDIWENAVKGLENEPERGKRCDVCFYLRLRRAARYAKENGFTRFSSVLGISRYKDFDQVCRAGRQAAADENIPYDETNWRKNGGEQRRAALTKSKNLYAQTYCGCKPRISTR